MNLNMLRTVFIVLALCLAIPDHAQSRKRRAAQAPKPVEEEKTPADSLFEALLPNVQRVFFIDSMVVERSQLLQSIPLDTDLGSIMSYREFFETPTASADDCVYVNGFGNRCFYSRTEADGRSRLYTRQRLGDNWGEEQRLEGIDGFSTHMGFPYMDSDGATFYFAAQSETEGLGGYDLFVTRYDSDDGRFLQAENLGLPFNSPANDYFLVVDDTNGLGWFATDRNQPEGMACIYTFIPSDVRRNYSADEYEEEQLKQLAAISSIKDTWTSDKLRKQALARAERLRNSPKRNWAVKQEPFVVSDERVYNSVGDFKSKTAARKYTEYEELRQQLNAQDLVLDSHRKAFHSAKGSDRLKLQSKIISMEESEHQMLNDLQRIANEIRAEETAALNTQR